MRKRRSRSLGVNDLEALRIYVGSLAKKQQAMSQEDWKRFLAEEAVQDDAMLSVLELSIELQLRAADLAVRDADRGVKVARTAEAKREANVRLVEAIRDRRLRREEWEKFEEQLEHWRSEYIKRICHSAEDPRYENEHGRQDET